jgi:transcriptional regulator with XRE-family HTH domain
MDLEDASRRMFTGRRAKSFGLIKMVTDAIKALGTQKAVAARLGVSARQISRWRHGQTKAPTPDNMRKLKDLGNAAEVRRSQRRPRRMAKMRRRGAKLTVEAKQGPTDPTGQKYQRWRELEFELPGAAVARLEDAWLQGGTAAYEAELERVFEDYYGVSGWSIDEVDTMTLKPR